MTTKPSTISAVGAITLFMDVVSCRPIILDPVQGKIIALNKSMAVSPELLEILRCPKCKSELEINEEQTRLKCLNADCCLVYPIRDDIPVMLIDEATVEK